MSITLNDKIAIFSAIGEAVSRWAELERQLTLLLIKAISITPDREIVELAEIRNLPALLDRLENVLEPYLARDQRAYWESLRRFIDELYQKREIIIHNPVAIVGPKTEDDDRPDPSRSQFRISNDSNNPLAPQGPHGEFDVSEVYQIRNDMTLAKSYVADLLRELSPSRRLPERFSQPISQRQPRACDP